jgi:hypothetical protein
MASDTDVGRANLSPSARNETRDHRRHGMSKQSLRQLLPACILNRAIRSALERKRAEQAHSETLHVVLQSPDEGVNGRKGRDHFSLEDCPEHREARS